MANKKLYTKQMQLLTVILGLYLRELLILPVSAEIRSRTVNSVNANNLKNEKHDMSYVLRQQTANDGKTLSSTGDTTPSATSTASSQVNTDFMDKLSWKCANNASCLYSLASGILNSYRHGDTIKFGFMDLVKLSKPSTKKTKSKTAETGRSISKFVDFISGNAIRIPVGPMVFSVQRAEDNDNYIEVALLRKATSTGRLGDRGDGGGVHGIINRIKGHKEKDDKKQMQMFIPMYLAATTFGWTMMVAKAVGFLTLKALAISKLAFIVAAMVLIKKLMDNASEKMMYQYPEQSPYMMPYNIDYGIHSMAVTPPEIAATADIYGGIPLHAAVAPLQGHQSHPSFEHLTAESTVHQNIADDQNNTQVLAALNAVGLGQKVKREDKWLGQIAAAVTAEIVVDENEKRLKFKSDFFGDSYIDDEDEEEKVDEIFNGEESILAVAHAARRPAVYNYLNPHTAYYRS